MEKTDNADKTLAIEDKEAPATPSLARNRPKRLNIPPVCYTPSGTPNTKQYHRQTKRSTISKRKNKKLEFEIPQNAIEPVSGHPDPKPSGVLQGRWPPFFILSPNSPHLNKSVLRSEIKTIEKSSDFLASSTNFFPPKPMNSGKRDCCSTFEFPKSEWVVNNAKSIEEPHPELPEWIFDSDVSFESDVEENFYLKDLETSELNEKFLKQRKEKNS